MLRDKVLLAFGGLDDQPLHGAWAATAEDDRGLRRLANAGQGKVLLTFGDATRNVLVTGTTGSGKTVSVMLPALRRLIESGCSGVVLSAKEEDAGLAAEYPQRTLLLGASRDATPVNLIGGMAVEPLRALLERLTRTRATRDPYWGSRAIDYALLVHQTYRLWGRATTLADLHDALSHPRSFVERFDAWVEGEPTLPRDYLSLLHSVRADAFSILAAGGSRHAHGSSSWKLDEDVRKQYAWHVNHMLPSLHPFAADERLRSKLADPAAPALDMTQVLYRARKVVVTDLPAHLFGATAALVHELLRIRLREAVLGYAHHRAEGWGRDRFTFLAIDEYQQHVHFAPGGASSGLLDDNLWLDRSRSSGHINLLATQGVASLAARLPGGCPPATVESLLQNCGTTIAFATHDPHTLAHLQAQAGPAAREAVLEACGVRLRQGQAVVVSHQLEHHGGPVCATVRAGATAGYPHMASGLHQPLPEVAADRFAPPATVMLDNPLGPSHGDIEPWANWLIGGADYRVDELRDLLRGRRGRRLMSASLDFPDNAREREVRLERRGDTLYLEAKREGGSGAWSLTMPFREAVDLVEMPGLAERDCGARGVAITEAPWSVERHDDQPARRAGVRISYARSLSVDVEQHDWDWFVFIVRGFCDLLLRVEREGPRGRMIRDREDHPG